MGVVRHKILENEPSPEDEERKQMELPVRAFVANLIETVVSQSSPSKQDKGKTFQPDPSKITPDAKSAPAKKSPARSLGQARGRVRIVKGAPGSGSAGHHERSLKQKKRLSWRDNLESESDNSHSPEKNKGCVDVSKRTRTPPLDAL